MSGAYNTFIAGKTPGSRDLLYSETIHYGLLGRSGLDANALHRIHMGEVAAHSIVSRDRQNTPARDQRCPCGTKLSRYNTLDLCALCDHKSRGSLAGSAR